MVKTKRITKDAYRDKVRIWNKQGTIVRVNVSSRPSRARTLGYKSKQGFVLARVRIKKGGRKRPGTIKGKKPKRAGRVSFTPRQRKQAIAEKRVAKKYPNLEVLNSFYVGEDGTKKYYEVIMNMPLFIPHSKSSSDFCELLDEYPVKPYLDSRKDLTKWVHFIHNRLNEKLNLPQKDYDKFEAEYFAQYKNSESDLTKERNISSSAFFSLFDFKYRDLVYLLILLALGSTIYYSRKQASKML